MTKPSRTTSKIPRKNWKHYGLTIFLAVASAVIPSFLGFDIMIELGLIVAICGFIGKLGKAGKQPFFVMLLICAIIGIGIIFPGAIMPELPYQSISYFGTLNAMVLGAFLGCLILSIEYTAL